MAQRNRRLFGLFAFFAAGAFLYLSLFIFPDLPIWRGGDQTIWLADAERMLRGEELYRDFFQMTFPATHLYYLGLFRLFGPRTWIPDLTLGLLGLGIAVLLYRVSGKILRPHHAPVPVLLFLTLIFHEKFDATHHWFSIIAVLAGLAVLIDKRTPGRIFSAGVLCGLSACFTQSHGFMAFLAFGFFLIIDRATRLDSWQSLAKRLGMFLAGFSLPVGFILGIYLPQVGWSRFFYCTFLFPIKYHHAFQIACDWRGYMVGLEPLVHSAEFWKLGAFLLVHALVPLIYIWILICCSRGFLRSDPAARARVLLISLLGLFLLFSVASSPTWSRLYYVSFPAILLFPWWLERTRKIGQRFLAGLYVATIALMIGLPLATQVGPHFILDLPVGRTVFLNKQLVERYQWIAARTRPGDYLFGGFYPDFYFLLGLKNPATVPYITPDDFTRPQNVADAVAGLEAHKVEIVLWAAFLDMPPIPATDHLHPLRAYLRQHYRILQRFPDHAVWIRTD